MAVFDPKLVVLQILALQCFYYVTMGLVLLAFRMLFGTQVTSTFLVERLATFSSSSLLTYRI